MSNVIRDLWPDDIKSEETVSPQTILEYQAEQLAKRTNGMLSAHVVRSVAEDRVVLGFEVKSLIAGSRVRLFAAQHRLEFDYPVALIPPEDRLPQFLQPEVYEPGPQGYPVDDDSGIGGWVENKWVAASPAEFTNKVEAVLAQPVAKAVVLSLLSRANRVRSADEKE
jgi:hypothetical protein